MSALLDTDAKRSGERPPAATLSPELSRRLLIVAFRPAVVTLTLIAAMIVTTLVAANSDLTGTAAAVGACWLGVHQVQIMIGSTAIGVLPLLPTFFVLWAVARSCGKVVEPTMTRRELYFVVAAAVLGPLTVTVICLAIVQDASEVLILAPPNTLAALGWVTAIHAVGAVIGICASLWRHIVVSADVPSWILGAALAAIAAGRRLVVAGAVVTALSLVASWPVATSLFDNPDGFAGVIGLTVLSLAYFPNVVVGTLSVLTGSSAGIGDASVSLFGIVGGPVPGLPVMAAVPTGEPRGWWLALLAVPAYVAVQLGRECAASATDRVTAARSAALAAVGLGIVAVVLAFMAGGALGSFGYLGADAPLFGAMMTGWMLLLGSVTAFIVGRTVALPDTDAVSDDEPAPVRAEPAAIDAEIVDEPNVLEAPKAVVVPNDPDAPIDAEVVDLPETGEAPGV